MLCSFLKGYIIFATTSRLPFMTLTVYICKALLDVNVGRPWHVYTSLLPVQIA